MDTGSDSPCLNLVCGNFLFQQLDNLFGYRCSARREALKMGEIILIYYRVTNKPDEDRWDNQYLFDLVPHGGAKHIFHSKGRQHVDLCIEEDRYMYYMVPRSDCPSLNNPGSHGAS